MTAYSHEMLIDQTTGELDWTFIKRHAVVRAEREYGSSNPPLSYVRDEIRYLKDIAGIMRKRWREAKGLPDDEVYVMVTPYGKEVSGVRRSAF